MPYIGKEPADSFISFAKQDFTTSATTSYTLDNAVANENELALFINFVRQEPTTAYTASGTTLTLTSATASSDDMYCVYLGQAKQTVNAPDGSVGSSQVAASIITGQTALGATPADTDELLISDAGTLKRVDYSYLKSANTPAFEARNTGSQTGLSDNTWTKATLNSETYDTDNAFDSSTNYRFTPQTAGKYFFYAKSSLQVSSYNDLRNANARFYKNGSEIAFTECLFTPYGDSTGGTSISPFIAATVDMNGSSDYVEYYIKINGLDGTNQTAEFNLFGGYKIIGA